MAVVPEVSRIFVAYNNTDSTFLATPVHVIEVWDVKNDNPYKAGFLIPPGYRAASRRPNDRFPCTISFYGDLLFCYGYPGAETTMYSVEELTGYPIAGLNAGGEVGVSWDYSWSAVFIHPRSSSSHALMSHEFSHPNDSLTHECFSEVDCGRHWRCCLQDWRYHAVPDRLQRRSLA